MTVVLRVIRSKPGILPHLIVDRNTVRRQVESDVRSRQTRLLRRSSNAALNRLSRTTGGKLWYEAHDRARPRNRRSLDCRSTGAERSPVRGLEAGRDSTSPVRRAGDCSRPDRPRRVASRSEARRVFAALKRIGWRHDRTVGSHKIMKKDGWADYPFFVPRFRGTWSCRPCENLEKRRVCNRKICDAVGNGRAPRPSVFYSAFGNGRRGSISLRVAVSYTRDAITAEACIKSSGTA